MKVRQEEPVRPGQVVHGYRIERKLGQGGFSQVYLAWQGERPYALKFTSLQLAHEWAKRELHILLGFQHANVVRLVGHVQGPVEAREYLVLVMEYVPGRRLYDWADEENPSAREVARVVARLCRALAAMHAQEVLHRDFKGDNVLVRDGDGEPVLVDFGVSAVPWAPRVTQGGMAPGTPSYRSPECVRFIHDRERTVGAKYPYAPTDDLFALGVTLYVLLSGLYPFYGFDEWELMREIVQEVPKAPHARSRRVPLALSELCMRLLDKEPSARFQSAREVGEALESMLAEADASWDMPLCYGWDAAGLSTENEPELVPLDEEERWRRIGSKHARRGRKPPPAEAPAPPPVALVPVPVEPPPVALVPSPTPPSVALVPSTVVSPGRPAHAVSRSSLPRTGGVLGLLGVGLGGALLLLTPSPRRDSAPRSTWTPTGPALAPLLRAEASGGAPTWEAYLVREVAPPWKPPEAGAGAAPARVNTPAPVVPVTTLPKGETRLKKREQKALDTQEEARGLGADLARWCVGAAAVANAACPAVQVRPEPAPQECPAGALEMMTDRFRIPIGQEGPGVMLPGADLDAPRAEPIPVQEGPVSLFLGDRWGKLPDGTVLSGRLVFGPKRVQGRFTEAHLPTGERVPVCFALAPHDPRAPKGLEIEGTVGPETVKVYPFAELIAVERFE